MTNLITCGHIQFPSSANTKSHSQSAYTRHGLSQLPLVNLWELIFYHDKFYKLSVKWTTTTRDDGWAFEGGGQQKTGILSPSGQAGQRTS